jgi:two-component system sensor histidine kinase UhpB
MATILIIDDESSIREVLNRFLSGEGHRIVEAVDVEQGWLLSQTECPQLVITDIVMPKADGFAFLRRFCAGPTGLLTPVVVYTGLQVDHEFRELAQACGVEFILQKPASPRLFLDTVNKALGSTPSGRDLPPEFEQDYYRLLANQLVVKLQNLHEEAARRRQLERTLRESEERLRLALDAAHLGIFDWDIAHNHITWSHWHEELWGFAPGEFAGTYEAFSSRVHPDDLPGINAEVARCMAARQRYLNEFRVVWPDGSVRWISGTGEFEYGADGQAARMRGAVMEITERKRAEEALRVSRESLAVLSRQLITAQETERRNVARELHDEIGQVLTAVHIGLQQLKGNVGAGTAPRLDENIGIVSQAIKQVRDLSLSLRPALLDDFGLEAALKWFVEHQRERLRCQIDLVVRTSGTRLPTELRNTCFRVIQEALTNAARHAQARHVWIELHQQEAETYLTVRDDGVGFDLTAARGRAVQGGSFGILAMQERVELLGGQFDIETASGKGTTVWARLHVPSESSDDGALEDEEA